MTKLFQWGEDCSLSVNKLLINLLFYGYLALPTILFLLNWVELYISLPLVLLAVAFPAKGAWRSRNESIVLDKKQLLTFGMVFVLLFVVVWSTGLNFMATQSTDFYARNAVFIDLVKYSWPVVYDDSLSLNYYFGFWLPAALTGKMFGLDVAKWALHLWATAGLFIAWVCLSKYVGRYALIVAFMLVFWDGIYDTLRFIGLPVMHETRSVLIHFYDTHNHVLFSLIFAFAIMANCFDRRSVFLFFSFLCINAPITCLVLPPILVYYYLFRGLKYSNPDFSLEFWRRIREFISFPNICGGLISFIIFIFYMCRESPSFIMVNMELLLSPFLMGAIVGVLLLICYLSYDAFKKDRLIPVLVISIALLFLMLIVNYAGYDYGFNDLYAKGSILYTSFLLCGFAKTYFLSPKKRILACCFIVVSAPMLLFLIASKISGPMRKSHSEYINYGMFNGTMNCEDAKNKLNFYFSKNDQNMIIFKTRNYHSKFNSYTIY